MSAPLDLSGQRFGRLVAAALSDRTARGSRWWVCRCDCGGTTEVRTRDLRSSHTKSCGCISRRHGYSHTRIHRVWKGIVQRCENPKHIGWKHYGGRGISICPEWRADFRAFLSWALEHGYSDSLQIDRIDNDAGYSPANYRFVPAVINNRNRSFAKLSIEDVELIREELAKGYLGVGRRMAERFGVSPATISHIAQGKVTLPPRVVAQ